MFFAVFAAYIILLWRIMLYKKEFKIPILSYHSISDNADWLSDKDISIPVRHFEEQIKYLKKHEYTTVSLLDVYNYIKHKKNLPPSPVVLTFDDGYLDNWVSVYPVLKKYNLKATLFIPTGFIISKKSCRPNMEDVWNCKINPGEIDWSGYLSWNELKIMENSGVFDIQSHTVTHIYHKNLLEKYDGDIKLKEKIYKELVDSKDTLEQKLHKNIRFLAWPNEEMNEMMFFTAIKEAGYLATTGFRGFNSWEESPETISRTFIPNVFCGLKSNLPNMLGFKSRLHFAEGNYFYSLILSFDFLWKKFNKSYGCRVVKSS